MSDISLHFGVLDWIAIAFMLGWPGLIVGAAAGVLLMPKRRIAAAAVCGVAAMLVVFLVRLFLL
jgi:uncharacterized membrane protein YoaK (UPF0700 family)